MTPADERAANPRPAGTAVPVTLDLDPRRLNHSRTCKGGRIVTRAALTRPGWTVYRCEGCKAIAVQPDPVPTPDLLTELEP